MDEQIFYLVIYDLSKLVLSYRYICIYTIVVNLGRVELQCSRRSGTLSYMRAGHKAAKIFSSDGICAQILLGWETFDVVFGIPKPWKEFETILSIKMEILSECYIQLAVYS